MSSAAARDRLNAELARVADGDRAALKRVYDATAAKLFGICLRATGDRETAEDALQETYLKVWRRAGRFDPRRASAITWLCLIARGTAIDARRVAGRAARGLDALADHSTLGSSAPGDAERQALSDCIDTLPEDTRGFILSAFVDGYTYDELAQRAAVPLGTMKSRIRRGLLALRRCLTDA